MTAELASTHYPWLEAGSLRVQANVSAYSSQRGGLDRAGGPVAFLALPFARPARHDSTHAYPSHLLNRRQQTCMSDKDTCSPSLRVCAPVMERSVQFFEVFYARESGTLEPGYVARFTTAQSAQALGERRQKDWQSFATSAVSWDVHSEREHRRRRISHRARPISTLGSLRR